MKVAVIGTAGVPGNYGGFETLAHNLVTNIGDNVDFVVYCSSRNYKDRPKYFRNAKLVYLPLNANGVSSIFYDIVSMFHALFFADVFLVLGVSGCLALPVLRRLTRKKIVVHIDGIEWKREKWGKRARWLLRTSERMAVQYGDVIISDNKAIQDYVADVYATDSEMIEYGGDHVLDMEGIPEVENMVRVPYKKYAIKVCRIEPENNIELILEAFKNNKLLPLVCIGNWDNGDYGADLKKKYAACKNITLLDPIYCKKTLYHLRSNASVYIHGHSAGGTNPSLVEAMSMGLPVLAYAVSYNRETTKNKANYFTNQLELERLLMEMDDSSLEALGQNMKAIAVQDYTWKRISGKYEQIFKNPLAETNNDRGLSI